MVLVGHEGVVVMKRNPSLFDYELVALNPALNANEVLRIFTKGTTHEIPGLRGTSLSCLSNYSKDFYT
jgi:hypothetical protein